MFKLHHSFRSLLKEAELDDSSGDVQSAAQKYMRLWLYCEGHLAKEKLTGQVTPQAHALQQLSAIVQAKLEPCQRNSVPVIKTAVPVAMPNEPPNIEAFFSFIPKRLDVEDGIRKVLAPPVPAPAAIPHPHPLGQRPTVPQPQGNHNEARPRAPDAPRSVVPAPAPTQRSPSPDSGNTPTSRSGSNRVAIGSRQRRINYGRGDASTEDDEQTSTTSNNLDFKSARDQYEEDVIKKNPSMASSANNSNGKKPAAKKRGASFITPFKRSDEDEDGYGDDDSSPEPTGSSKKPKGSEEAAEKPEYRGIDPEIAERIEKEILEVDLNVRFDDIAGLVDVKRTLYEMIVYPNLHPHLFTGLRRPARGLLLFGPPGNGKTMIARAVATEAKMTFFSVSASTLCSKWIGEGEKTVRALFAVARAKQPSFIFIDEIDSILSSRSSEEHESTRRLKNEFLVQFDGALTLADDRITVMGATNRPQDLDDAARRRLPKRVYVPLPEPEARRRLVDVLIKNENHILTGADLEEIGQLSEGYSCNDLSQVSREAAMLGLREIDLESSVGLERSAVRPITIEDFRIALRDTRPSVAIEDCKVYEQWNAQYGTVGGR